MSNETTQQRLENLRKMLKKFEALGLTVAAHRTRLRIAEIEDMIHGKEEAS
jgi:hypothetical protein